MRLLNQDVRDEDYLFLTRVAELCELTTAECLALLLPRPADSYDVKASQAVRTTLSNGRFVGLSMRRVAPILRERNAPFEIAFGSLPRLVYLDCAGLGLPRMQTDGLLGLKTLVCANNELRELDLSAFPRLRYLDCRGNQLMVLDLAFCPELTRFYGGGNQLASLSIPDGSRLKTLKCERNQLISVRTGEQHELRELNLYRNYLHHLELGNLPRLQKLDCARNELTELSLNSVPRLEQLICDTNRLGSLMLSAVPHLRTLKCSHNYLNALDLSQNTGLEDVACSHNQLERLSLGEHSELTELVAGNNAISTVDLRGCPALEVLDLSCNELGEVELGQTPRLASAVLSDNRIRSVTLTNSPLLAWLDVAQNSLTSLDLSAACSLNRLHCDDTLSKESVSASVFHQQLLAPLRMLFGHATGATDLSDMSPWELHDQARALAADHDEAGLMEVVLQESCDLGTALLAYWSTSPHYYRAFADRSAVPAYALPGWELVRAIEERVERNGFATAMIFFDPKNDKQVDKPRGWDWTLREGAESETGDEIPRYMREAWPDKSAT